MVCMDSIDFCFTIVSLDELPTLYRQLDSIFSIKKDIPLGRSPSPQISLDFSLQDSDYKILTVLLCGILTVRDPKQDYETPVIQM